MSNHRYSTKRYLLMLLCGVLARAIGRVRAGMGDTNRYGICERTGKPVGEGRSPVNGRGHGMGGNCHDGAPQAPSK
jgi:hypothetical protein